MRGFFAALEDDEPIVTKRVQAADPVAGLRKVSAALRNDKRMKGEEEGRGGDDAVDARATGGCRDMLRE